MAVNKFLARYGFESDPFASTNAESEPLLAEYFVPPPYFTAVMGNPSEPESHVVLAPRGSGKTAQRRMIEDASATSSDFLCVTYDEFDQPAGFKLADCDLAYHLNQICRLLLIGILLELEEDAWKSETLSRHQREVLKYQVERFLGTLSPQEYEHAIRSIKSLGDKFGEKWKKYGGPVAAGIQILLKKAGLDGVNVPSELVSEQRADESLRYHFEQLVGVANALWDGVYVLVDKADETQLTAADSDATFALVRALITDLPTLETTGVGFKFFMWDHIADRYRESGGRPDRVPILQLRWSIEELVSMLKQRLAAYSGGRISSLNVLQCQGAEVDLDYLVAYFAQGSPRDMIRAIKAIVNEATRISEDIECIDRDAVWTGIRQWSMDRANELVPAYLPELRKVNRLNFTIKYVSSDIFRVESQSGRAKIQKWLSTGVVEQVGTLPNPGNRPMHLFGITDLRVGVAVLQSVEVPLFLGNYALLCPECKTLVLADSQKVTCTHCDRESRLADCRSLWDTLSGA